jgi:hypothetical protein
MDHRAVGWAILDKPDHLLEGRIALRTQFKARTSLVLQVLFQGFATEVLF